MLTFTGSHTFTRPITADYVDINGVTQTAAIDEPRFEFADGEPIGLKFGAQDSATCPLTETWYTGKAGTYIIRAQAPNYMLIGEAGVTQIRGVNTFKTYVVRWNSNANLMAPEIDLFPNADVTAEPAYVAGHWYQPKYLADETIDQMIFLNAVINGDWA